TSSTSDGRVIRVAKSLPASIVSSSEAVRYVLAITNSLRKVAQQIGRDKALLGGPIRANFARPAVQPNGGDDCCLCFTMMLRDQTSDQARENVASPASRHGRTSGRVDPGSTA